MTKKKPQKMLSPHQKIKSSSSSSSITPYNKNNNNNNNNGKTTLTMMNSSPNFDLRPIVPTRETFPDVMSRYILLTLLKSKGVHLKSMDPNRKDQDLGVDEFENLSQYDVKTLTFHQWNELFEIYNMSGYDMRLLKPLIDNIKTTISNYPLPMDVLWVGIENQGRKRTDPFKKALSIIYKQKMDNEISLHGPNTEFRFVSTEAETRVGLKLFLNWFPRSKIFYPIVQNLYIEGHWFTDLKYFVPFSELKRFTLYGGPLTNLKDLYRFRKLEYLDVEDNKIANVDEELKFIGPQLNYIKMIIGSPLQKDKKKMEELNSIFWKLRFAYNLNLGSLRYPLANVSAQYQDNVSYAFEKFDNYDIETMLFYSMDQLNGIRNVLANEAARVALNKMSDNKTNKFTINYFMRRASDVPSSLSRKLNWIPVNTILCNITTTIDIEGYTFENLSPFNCFTNLETLHLKFGNLKTLDGVGRFTKLTSLNVSDNQIDEIDSNSGFANLTNLTYFNFYGNPVTYNNQITDKTKWIRKVMFTILKLYCRNMATEFWKEDF
jgi:hypothetical protein